MPAHDILPPSLAELVHQIDQIGSVPCSSYPELFFYEPYAGLTPEESITAAKRLCGECPLKVECLRVALETKRNVGIWGGLTPEERKALRKR
jgi:WhiB family redox-sensing transcriptional regulator